MTRARKTEHINDGMNLLQVMPFPAFNPWNWWALASPGAAMLAGLKSAEMALHAWRVSADAMRAAVRQQQDAMLGALHGKPEGPPPNGAAEAVAREDAADFLTPMVEATRAYGRVGKAFIVAQRNTLRAFAGSAEKPH